MSEYVCFVGGHEFRKGIHRHVVKAESVEAAAYAARIQCQRDDMEVVEVFVHTGTRFATGLVEVP